LSEDLALLLPLIKLREQVYSEVNQLNPKACAESIQDLKNQLKELWSSDVLLSSRPDFFDNYNRYHQAIEKRIKRIKSNFPKEAVALDVWQAWQSWWQELQENRGDLEVKPQLDDLFWSLQEFRVHLFSPGIKTEGSVSIKKLQKIFDSVESQLNAAH